MKKTLIAMAATATLATSGAAFAQATITGYMSAGYATSTTGGATSATTSGFGVDTSTVNFTASEDLGKGLIAGGAMGFDGMSRMGSFSGGNFGIFVQNASAKLSIGVAKGGDYISSGLASSGVNYYDFGDYGNFGARSSRDYINLDVPMGPISFLVSHQEGGNLAAAFAGGEGAAVTGVGQRINVLSATYAEGAIKLNTQYINYDNQTANSEKTAANAFRLSGNYNLGVATVGAGLQLVTYSGSNTARNMGASVSVPLGSLTLGAMIGSRLTEKYPAAADNATQASYSVSANYALSKRTSVIGQYSNWDRIDSVVKGSLGLLLLAHSF